MVIDLAKVQPAPRAQSGRILVFVHECIWPVDCGFHARAWQLIDGLIDLGLEVNVVSSHGVRPRRMFWSEAAREHFRKRGIRLDLAPFGVTSIDFWSAAAHWFVLTRLLRRPFISPASQYYYRPQLLRLWRARLAEGGWTGALVNHTVYYRLAQAAREAKIWTALDMHDLLAGQFVSLWQAREKGQPPAKLLRRIEADELGCMASAHCVLAINPTEGAFVRPKLGVPVIDVPFCLPDLRSKGLVEPAIELLVVGSFIDNNRRGLAQFLQGAWPALKAARPDIRLVVCGGVGSGMLADANITWHPRVDDLTPFYQRAQIVLLVSVAGTGIKIKTIEALAHGCCVVAHQHCVEGIPFTSGVHGEVVSDLGQAQAVILRLLGDEAVRSNYQARAAGLFRERFELARGREALAAIWAAGRAQSIEAGFRDRVKPPQGSTTTTDYERNSREYDQYWSARWRRTHTYSAQTKVRRFRALLGRHGLKDRNEQKIFDQGFGLGLMLFCFPRTCEIAGLELGRPAVEAAAAVAAQKGYGHVDLRVFEPGKPYPAYWTGRFDVAISSHVLEHIENPRPALDALVSVLSPGGLACIVVPINERPGEDLNHFHQFTEASIRDLVSRSGLEIIEVSACDRLLNLIKPVAARQQRAPSRWDRAASLLFNLVFGFMPLAGLKLADAVLARLGWTECQCFVLARKPGGPPQ